MSAPERIAPPLWGCDHWTTFAYLGHVVHGGGAAPSPGEPNPDKMRCKRGSPRTGPVMALAARAGVGGDYPTRLRDGTLVRDHDDYDCAEDLEAAGLLTNLGTGMHPVYALTNRGLLLWSALVRAYRTTGAMRAATWEGLCASAGLPLDEERAATGGEGGSDA